jgi:putative ABC transport system substrate-binding protein
LEPVKRRDVVVGLGIAGLLISARAGAQAPSRMVRIGLLDHSGPDAGRLVWWQAFRQQLAELGWVEGRNVALESRWANGETERLAELAAELVRLPVDVIVTGGAESTHAARQATTTIPIVMATGADPVALGLVSNLARPGGNVTGVTSLTSDLNVKRVQLLREFVPKVVRIGVLWSSTVKASAMAVRDTQMAAGALGVTILAVSVRRPSEFDDAFRTMARDGAGAVILVQSPPFYLERKQLADLALKHRLPAFGGPRDYAEAGALASYAPRYPDFFQRAAVYVDRILRGARPGDLPVEQPTTYELVINLRTARALGLAIPQALIVRAEHLIE